MSSVIGTAGWNITRDNAFAFPEKGTSLDRYANVFRGVEVNSSFHRPHRASTWAKWASSVPDNFRFSVKIPKMITHERKLVDVENLIDQFASEVGALGSKLAVALVQLPPKLVLEPVVASKFFEKLRGSVSAKIVCEPRNASWFEKDAGDLLEKLHVARVAADPALGKLATVPGGWRGIAYWRLHGSPMMYRSSYSETDISHYAREMRTALDECMDTWCMFDNTASSAALNNALSLIDKF